MRLAFLHIFGELVFYSTLILIGGAVLTGITIALFLLIGVNVEGWYLRNVVVWGVLAAPLVACVIFDVVLAKESRVSTVVAKAFTPLFLITTVIYLIVMVAQNHNPYDNREFLITFNGLLALVWGMTVLTVPSQAAQGGSRMFVFVNTALVAVTLIIDSVALSAILFRLVSFGLTPNRVAVTGFNLLVFVHLEIILIEYVKELRGKDSDVSGWVSRYLPVYSLWALFVVVFMPPLFGFR